MRKTNRTGRCRRDSDADQRFYSSGLGRFTSADRYQAKAKGANDPINPGSWNRYSYVQGDPINNRDPRGLFIEAKPIPDDQGDDSDPAWGDGEYGEFIYGTQRIFIPPPPRPYVQVSIQQRQKLLQGAEDLALKALDSTDCQKLFNINNEGPDPRTLLEDLVAGSQYGRIQWGYNASWDQQGISAVTSGSATSVTITLNNNGNGLFVDSSAISQAGTLLHELGHALDLLFGPDASAMKWDAGNTQQSEDNTRTVFDSCLKGLVP